MSAFIVAPASAGWRCLKCGQVWPIPGLHQDCDGGEFTPVRPLAVSPKTPSLRVELRRRGAGRAARWRRLMREFALQWKDATRTARTLERLGFKHDALKWWQQSLEAIYQAVFCRQRAKGRP